MGDMMDEIQRFNSFGFIVALGSDNKSLRAIKANKIEFFENFLYEDEDGETYQGCRFYVGGNAIESTLPLNGLFEQLSEMDPSLR
jgi:hypothetical protein